uniref:GAG-pre-integrase domain-containing protein n=1 Tax=Fagus sylvatica TaxID=28930 RepID=A0A2N9J5X0_FAGSY
MALCDLEQRLPPKQQKDETEDVFALQLEDWDGVNHQIITWLRNTSTPSVSMEFGGYDITKDIWDMLASRYARIRWLLLKLVIKTVSEAELVSAHRERLRIHQLLMGIIDDFESDSQTEADRWDCTRKVGWLFELTSLHLPSSSVFAHPLLLLPPPSKLWHSRLGHVSLPRIKTLVSRGLLGSVSSSPFDCMPCQLGKQPALPFNNRLFFIPHVLAPHNKMDDLECKLRHILDIVRTLTMQPPLLPYSGVKLLSLQCIPSTDVHRLSY